MEAHQEEKKYTKNEEWQNIKILMLSCFYCLNQNANIPIKIFDFQTHFEANTTQHYWVYKRGRDPSMR